MNPEETQPLSQSYYKPKLKQDQIMNNSDEDLSMEEASEILSEDDNEEPELEGEMPLSEEEG